MKINRKEKGKRKYSNEKQKELQWMLKRKKRQMNKERIKGWMGKKRWLIQKILYQICAEKSTHDRHTRIHPDIQIYNECITE